MVAAYRAGLSLRTIGYDEQLAPSTVRRILLANDVVLRPMGGQPGAGGRLRMRSLADVVDRLLAEHGGNRDDVHRAVTRYALDLRLAGVTAPAAGGQADLRTPISDANGLRIVRAYAAAEEQK